MEPSPPRPSNPPPVAPLRPRPDPEFAAEPFPTAPLPPDFPLADHQRLVVNPFLAVAGLVGWAWLTGRLLRGPFPPLGLVPTCLLFCLPFLIHYHCLDCGATGIYPRRARHACAKVVRRGQLDRPAWFRWPRARTQLILWGYVLGATGLLLAVVVGLGGAPRARPGPAGAGRRSTIPAPTAGPRRQPPGQTAVSVEK